MLKINMLYPKGYVSTKKVTLEKLCTKCNTLQLRTNYYKSADRCVAYCKPCMAKYAKIRRLITGVTKVLRFSRNPVVKTCVSCRLEKPKAEFSKKGPNSYASWCKACKNAYTSKTGKETNWATSKASTHRRRVRLKGSIGTFTAQEWLLLKEYYDFTCLSCKRKEPEIKLTIDHVIPVSRNGSGYITNIQPLCGQCNSSKSSNIIDYRGTLL